MHNNYYFLRQLSKSLEKILVDSVISECFSQHKDEMILRFETRTGSFYIKASVLPNFSCLSFPAEFHRARKNSVDLFERIIGRRVIQIRQFKNERSFAVLLPDSFSLLFKMHGNRANILLFEKNEVADLFRNSLQADKALKLDSLDREIDWSAEAFEKNQNSLASLYFTFGKVVWHYLETQDFNFKKLPQKWELIQSILKELEAPAKYYVAEIEQTPVLSLLKLKVIIKASDEPLEACNDFYYTFTQLFAIQREKALALSVLKGQLQSGKNYHQKNLEKLHEQQHNNNYKEWADLIMANLHRIKPGLERVTLDNFYHHNLPTEIKLKKDLSAQKNAEVYYKKSKNQQSEVNRLQQGLRLKEEELQRLEKAIREVESADDLKTIKKLQAEFTASSSSKRHADPLPYHEFLCNGFKIWVGKNAQSNDTLTLKLGHKDDLWLHAKDVAGSHVLIKYQSGKNFPKDVIERAAELAAYNSKRKNESLCPVIVTQKKYVRKRKGDPAGAVVAEKEEVMMVVPKL